MSKRWIWLVGLVCCLAFSGLSIAESVEWDAEAVKSMSRDERIAYQRAYKAKLDALAQGTQKREFAPSGRQAGAPNKAVGTITYHSGALGPCCTASFMQGNQFDSALDTSGTVIAPVMMSGSITMATFDMVTVVGSAAFFSAFDQLAGTAANFLISTNIAAATGLNAVTLGSPVVYAGTSFLAGMWQGGGDVPAVATGTVGGQGFHGIEINDIVGTGFATIGALNGATAVGGNVLTPVELLNFEVE